MPYELINADTAIATIVSKPEHAVNIKTRTNCSMNVTNWGQIDIWRKN